MKLKCECGFKGELGKALKGGKGTAVKNGNPTGGGLSYTEFQHALHTGELCVLMISRVKIVPKEMSSTVFMVEVEPEVNYLLEAHVDCNLKREIGDRVTREYARLEIVTKAFGAKELHGDSPRPPLKRKEVSCFLEKFRKQVKKSLVHAAVVMGVGIDKE